MMNQNTRYFKILGDARYINPDYKVVSVITGVMITLIK